MIIIKIILIILIYILITLILTKIYFKQFDYFTTKYGYECKVCTSCEDIGKATISDCVKPDDTICADRYTPIYVTGYAESGSHGNNDATTSTTFNLQLVNIYQDIVDISMAFRNSLFLTETGHVYSCGINGPNLGLGTLTTNVLIPKKIDYFDNVGKIIQVSTSNTHSLFLTENHRVYFCGYSANGADGTNVSYEYNTPEILNFFNKPSITSVNYISTSNSSCIVIVNDGDVYYTGQNNFNKFNDDSNRIVIYEFTLNSFLNNNGIKISKVYQELSCTMFLTDQGQVYVAGKNDDRFGFESQENTIEKIPFFDTNGITIIQISIGTYHTLFLTSDNKVYGCGRTNYGQLGLGDLGTEAKDYTIVEPKKLTFFDDLNVIKVVAGAFHSLFLTKSGFVYGSGKNDSGQFGIQNIGSTTTYYNPIKITTNYKKNIFTFSNPDIDKSYSMFINKLAYDKVLGHTCNAKYYEEDNFCSTCTECQDVGKYYYDDCTSNRDTICEDKYTLLYVTGKNLYGELGETYDTSTPIQLTNLKKKIQQISICNNSSMFLTNLGEVYACGNNTNGKLGLGNNENQSIITKITTFDTENVIIKQVSVGCEHCLFLTKTGSVYFSGRGDWGRKGLGEDNNKNDEINPIKLTFFDTIGKIRYVYAGDKTSFCVTEGGDLYCCGYNTEGQLGLGTSISLGYSYIEHEWKLNTEISDIKQIVNYGTVTTFLTNNGNVYSCTYIASWHLGDHGLGEPEEHMSTMVSTPKQVNIDGKIIQLARGNQHTLFLTETGQVYSCGQNRYGQLGFNDGGFSTPILISSLSGINIVKVAAGYNHSLFLTNLGEVYGCGNNTNGAIGINDNNNIYLPRKIETLNIIKDIYANNSLFYTGDPTGESSIFISKLVYNIPDESYNCDTGFYKDDEELRCNSCTVCKDIYKLHVGDCTITSDTDCSDMPQNSTFNPTDDNEFLCLAGYYAGFNDHEGQCLPCQSGWYKNEVGNEPCDPCDSYMTSPEGSTLSSDCQCMDGYGWDGSKCTECQEGWYKNEVSNEACEPCEEGTFKEFAGSGECEQCPSNMTSVSGSTECVCDEGFESLAGAPCTVCRPGHYKYQIGPGPCESCGPTQYLAPSGVCEALPSNSDSNDDNTDFICRDNYYKSGDLCKPKPSNADTNEDKTDFICRNGFYKSGDSCPHCRTCEKGWGLIDCNIDGSTASGTCTACQDGYYNDFPRKAPCKTLPPRSRAKQKMSNGVLVNYDWTCMDNYYLKVIGNEESCELCIACESGKELMGCGDDHPGFCAPCPDTMWKSGNNRGSCKDRPPNSQIIQMDGLNIGIECDEGYSLMGESCLPHGCDESAVCDSGYELTGCNVHNGRAICNKCPDNMWKMDRNTESCRELPQHSTPITRVRKGETLNIGFECNFGYVIDGYTCVRNQ
jgi:alpha-tubulin suppressor-like RCC1 family protein